MSRHIKLYNMDTMQVAFSHELYERMQWRQLSPSFYAFEISNGMAGISFASTEDVSMAPLRHCGPRGQASQPA